MKLLDTEIRQLIEIITKQIGEGSIYVFGSRPCHFDILVITDASVNASHLMNEVAERTNHTITVTVLVHKPKHLKTKQGSQEYFFDRVLRNGQRLVLDRANVPYVLNHTPERDLESDGPYWQKCVAVAQFNIQAAKDSPQVGVGLCKIALLHLSCVQIAMGLIRVFMGYTPREHGLKYLLQLCGHFTDLPEQVFPVDTEDNKRLYKMLCAPAGLLLSRIKLDADEGDFEVLLERTELFLENAKLLAETEFVRLNNG